MVEDREAETPGQRGRPRQHAQAHLSSLRHARKQLRLPLLVLGGEEDHATLLARIVNGLAIHGEMGAGDTPKMDDERKEGRSVGQGSRAMRLG